MSARGSLGNIGSTDYVSVTSIRVIETYVLNRLGFGYKLSQNETGEELKLTNRAIGKVIFGKYMH